jgi:hypothetical protein
VNWRGWLAALFVILALTGCAQGVAGQAGAQYALYSPQPTSGATDVLKR